jgi:flagellar motor switch protein FliN/FliY
LTLIQGFSAGPGCAIRIRAAEAFWQAAGKAVLSAAGIEEAEAAEYRGTYQEVCDQAGGSLAQDLTQRLGREIAKTAGEAHEWEHSAFYQVSGLGDGLPALEIAASRALVENLAEREEQPAAQAAAASAGGGGAGGAGPVAGRTMDLLLEVELPVNVSFGRSQMRLKDLVKLSTGSIVELNRSVSEPVEVIVNNCVIARGEVVVVEGNYGVRIRQIVSRQERLRTLF